MPKKIALVLISALAVGCVESADDEGVATDNRIAEITENLVAAGYSEDRIEIIDFEDSVSVVGVQAIGEGPQVYLDGEIHVTLEASRELIGQVDEDDEFRHWRTPGLVTANSTICLVRALELIPEIGPAIYGTLSPDMSTGIWYARNNYNATGANLTFEVRNGLLDINGNVYIQPGDEVGCDHFIGFAQGWGALGGLSGFPAGGAPYPFVLMSGFANNQMFEHIATHEIGHAIGLRHSDWLTRISCGTFDPETQSGAVQIPGTANHTTNSIMNACLPGASNGEFRGEDVEAIEFIY